MIRMGFTYHERQGLDNLTELQSVKDVDKTQQLFRSGRGTRVLDFGVERN